MQPGTVLCRSCGAGSHLVGGWTIGSFDAYGVYALGPQIFVVMAVLK